MTIGLPHKMGLGRSAPIALATACILTACAAGLSGCATPFDGKIDTTSAAAGQVAAVEHMDLPYPRWSQFPAAPANVPTPAAFAASASAADADQAQLLGEASRLQWTLCCTEDWSARTRAAIDPALATPAPADADAQTEAFVKAMHDQATPPPPAPK